MFYTITDGAVAPLSLGDEGQLPSPLIGYLTLEELNSSMKRLALGRLELSEYTGDRFHTGIAVFDEQSVVTLLIRTLDEPENQRDKVMLILKKQLLLVVNVDDADESTINALKSAIERFAKTATLEKIIFGTLDSLLSDGSRQLEEYEQRIMALEGKITSGRIDETLNHEIYSMRNRLSVMRNYYEQLVDISETLQGNANDIFEQDELRYLRVFESKAQRLSNLTQTLGESLIHLRESLDATLNFSLSRTMNVLTVVSMIFLPLTLVTGWYGMNFRNMPELSWKWGYAGVGVFCVLILILCLIWFRRKKWL